MWRGCALALLSTLATAASPPGRSQTLNEALTSVEPLASQTTTTAPDAENQQFSDQSGLNEAGAEDVTTTPIKPPLEIRLKADRQRFDARRNLFIAEGNVRAVLNGGVLQADRIEFDSTFSTLYARGSVRFRRGSQYFQASTLLFSLIQNEGELSDVYGVLDLDSAALDFNPTSGSASSGPTTPSTPTLLPVVESSSLGFPTALELELETNIPERLNPQDDGGTFWDQELPPALEWLVPDTAAPQKPELGMACPPVLPPIPAWHPHPWAVTAWGGQMIDSNFGDTFLFNGRQRPEYLLGVSLQKRIWRAGPLSLELEADLFGHHADAQAGGRYNQMIPNADTGSQTFAEGVLGLGARLWIQPWLSFGFVEGISYNSAVSNYERTYRENYAQLLNYLAFELEAAVSDDFSVVGRIHHRSGAYGTYSGVREGSNAYLIGLRYRWGQDPAAPEPTEVPPPLGCPDPDRASRVEPQSLSEHLNAITLGTPDGSRSAHKPPSGPSTNTPTTPLAQTQASTLSLSEQEALRAKAIAAIDQRITSLQFQQSLSVDRRFGVPSTVQNSAVEAQNVFGAVQPSQLNQLGRTQLITGEISRWRIQAARVQITPDGWRADRMGFTNDPFTPAQTRIDADNVVATEQANGDILIKSGRNRLIVEERLPIPVSRTQRIQKQEEVENRWVFGIDNEDRNGFFIGRNLKPIEFNRDTILTLQPQVLLQRAIDGETDSYVAPGSSVDSGTVTQSTTMGDLFGLEAELKSQWLGWDATINADISTFNLQNIANGSRYWADFTNRFRLPWVGAITARLFGAYRYRSWNGSLGETDVYSAYGAFAEQKGNFNIGKLGNSYLWRIGVGNYQAESFTSTNLTDLWRANVFGSINSSYPLWRGQPAPFTPERAYRYSPVAIVPGLTLNTNLNTQLAAYGDGRRQNTVSFSGGPTLTLGTFSKPFLDYTQLSVTGGGTLKQGASPFDFDQAVDLGTLGVGLTQQIAGPLLISAGVALNVDPASEFYGDVINSNIEVRWQRRSYDFGFYYNPYEGIGGFRFRLNDFNFTGTGVPFIPYTPRNLPNELENRPF